MGHRNSQFPNHLLNSDANDQSHTRRQPEPCIFYQNVPSFHHPNVRTLITPPNNFNFHHIQEHSESAVFHNTVHYQGAPPQLPHANLDLSMAQPSNQYNSYLASSGDLSVQGNHGANVRLCHPPNAHYGTVNFPQITPLIDNDPLKRKSVEIASAVFPYHNISGGAGSSSSVNPLTSGPVVEFDGSQNAASFAPNEYVGNARSSFVEGEYSRSVRNSPMVRGSSSGHGPSPVPFQSNPWSDVTYGDIGTYLWPPPPNFPYMHASANGAHVEAGSLGFQSYQLAQSNRNSPGFMRPAFAPCPPFLHVQGSVVYGVSYPLQVDASSPSFPSGSSLNSTINPYHNVVDSGSTLVNPIPSPGVQLYGPPHNTREPLLGANASHRNIPGLRFSRVDETAILDIAGAHEAAAGSVDQHNEMRMDIEDMSYEELLALEEEIGFVATGLSEDFIENNMKSRNYALSEIGIDLEDLPSADQQINMCAVCQNEYDNGDVIGSLDCGHEYHKACIKQWLVMRNTCPVCKATALRNKEQ